MKGLVLDGLPTALIRAAYSNAPGNEIESGKFGSPESSAALVANVFGYFLERPGALPPLPSLGEEDSSPATALTLEGIVRFPWVGGRHPCLDVLITNERYLIGVESKRYEPFRSKSVGTLAGAYWRPVWGQRMRGYERLRDLLHDVENSFIHLDAVQLVKHAFGLRTAVHLAGSPSERRAVLYYLYAEPMCWPGGKKIEAASHALHRTEIAHFSGMVAGDEVQFIACSYRTLLAEWQKCAATDVREHASNVLSAFNV